MNFIHNHNATETLFTPATKITHILHTDTMTHMLFSSFFDKAGIALTVSFCTLAWRFYDKYRERTEKVLVESWVKSILEPVCITPLREKFLEFDKMYCTVSNIHKDTHTEIWIEKYRAFLDFFTSEMVAIDARFKIINLICKDSYAFIQTELDKVEDLFANYYGETLESELNLKEKEATEQMVRTQIYTSLNLISRNCFQLVHSGKVKKYLMQMPI